MRTGIAAWVTTRTSSKGTSSDQASQHVRGSIALCERYPSLARKGSAPMLPKSLHWCAMRLLGAPLCHLVSTALLLVLGPLGCRSDVWLGGLPAAQESGPDAADGRSEGDAAGADPTEDL